MTPTSIIIDCDPGVDDAIALLLAFASPELNLLGITTVAGNVPLALTTKNARKICELANRFEMGVFAGCARPILRSLETAEHVHGDTGLGDTGLGEADLKQLKIPEPIMPLQEMHGVDFLIETVMQSTEPITIATLGPLTNLAIALIKAPAIIPKIKEVVMMGGAITAGNVTASAEFNIYVDPHGAKVVMQSGLKLTLISLDVTHQVLTTPDRLQRIRAIGSQVSQVAAELLLNFGRQDESRYGMNGSPLHDPCVIAYLIQPDIFTSIACYVDVEVNSEVTMGRTIVDIWRSQAQHPNVNVVMTVDPERFYQLLIDRLARL